ncbi:MAG: cupin domain-containing protein [Telluria sp.]
MKGAVSDLLQMRPGAASERWPAGAPFVRALAHGSMSVELYAPVGSDLQSPHEQDELYFIQHGSGTIAIGDMQYQFAAGDCFFVAAGVEHRFTTFTPGFSTWVVFWGPKGGEAAQPGPGNAIQGA